MGILKQKAVFMQKPVTSGVHSGFTTVKAIELVDVLEVVKKVKETGSCLLCEEKTNKGCFVDHPEDVEIFWDVIDEEFFGEK